MTLDLLNRQRVEIRERPRYTGTQSRGGGWAARSQLFLTCADRGLGGSGGPCAIPGKLRPLIIRIVVLPRRIKDPHVHTLIWHQLQEEKCGSKVGEGGGAQEV